MNDKERAFNKQYAAKYNGIFLDNNSDNGRMILKEVERIRRKVNEYYNDRSCACFLSGEFKSLKVRNINPEVGKFHPYINVYAADKNEVNAFAGKIEEDYYIGFLKGVFLQLQNHIKKYIEDENFKSVSEIGKCAPIAVLNHLLNTCMDFLVFHEFFHIMNGHVDYIKELGICELCEINTVETKYGMIHQTLEYDADCCAIASILNEDYRMNQIFGDIGKVSVNSTIQFVSTVLIAMYILNEWLNTKYYVSNITEETLEKMTHPLPGIRTWYIWFTIQTSIARWKVYSEEEVAIIMNRSYEAAIKFIEIFSDIAYPGFLKSATQDLYINHMQKIHDNWKKVRELLTEHYCALAPYEKCDIKLFFGK